jgi:hypothetical protein
MRQDRKFMRLLSLFFLAPVIASCTTRNPDFCGDGTCIDPAKPYCDYHGDFGGKPGTCVAVMCEPNAFALCQGDTELRCNAMGNNYQTTRCSLGCDVAASGCRECTASNQCTDGKICDTKASSCRGCQLDDECESRVCDVENGRCVSQAQVVYASPTGLGGGAAICSLAQPCSIQKAIVLASNATVAPIVRLLPGTYIDLIKADVPTANIKVVATGATIFVLGNAAAVVVEAGATVDIRGLTGTSEHQVQCGMASTTAPISSLTLRHSTFTSPQNSPVFEIQRCVFNLLDADVSTGNNLLLGLHDDSSFVADRLRVHASGGGGNSIVAGGSRDHIDITNSVLDQTDIVLFFGDTDVPGSSLRLAFDTVFTVGGLQACQGVAPAYIQRTIENSIVAAVGTADALKNSGTNCMLSGVVLTHQASPLPGSTVADPQFVNAAASDFHLKSTSPCVDAVTTGSSNDHDVEGYSRPYGSAADIGGYEYHP